VTEKRQGNGFLKHTYKILPFKLKEGLSMNTIKQTQAGKPKHSIIQRLTANAHRIELLTKSIYSQFLTLLPLYVCYG